MTIDLDRKLASSQQYPNSGKTEEGHDPGRQLVPRESPTDEENGRGHHHPKHPGEEEVVPGPVPALDVGVTKERNEEGDPGAYHDFEDGFHTW